MVDLCRRCISLFVVALVRLDKTRGTVASPISVGQHRVIVEIEEGAVGSEEAVEDDLLSHGFARKRRRNVE